MIGYPLRYLNENFLQILGTLAIEISLWAKTFRRELAVENSTAFIGISIILILMYSISLFILVYLAIKQIGNQPQQIKVKLITFVKGLNQRS